MLSESAFKALKELAAGSPRKAELEAALDEMEKALVGQSHLIRKLVIQLEARIADDARMRQIVESAELGAAMERLRSPKRNTFTKAELTASLDELQAKVESANSLGEILGTVVKVATLFV